jgi:CHAT domain-containing protein
VLRARDSSELAVIVNDLNQPARRAHLDELVTALGKIFVNLIYSDPARAELVIERILTIADLLQVPVVRARGFSLYAQLVAIRDGDYQSALEFYDKSVAIFEEEQQGLARARVEVTRVAVLGSVGRLSDALEAFQQATSILVDYSDNAQLASLRLNTAVALMHGSRYREALGLLEQAEQYFEGAGLTASCLRTQVNKALCLAAIGDYRAALSLGEQIITDCESAGLTILQATQQLNSAQIQYCIGRYTTALQMLDQLRAGSRTEGLNQLQTMAGLSSADCLLLMGRYDEALKLCYGFVDEFAQRGDLRSSAQAHYNEGIALAGLRRFDEAQDALRSALLIFEGLEDRFWCAAVDWAAARIALSAGDLELALSLGRRSSDRFSATEQDASLEAYQARLLLLYVELEAGDVESVAPRLKAFVEMVRDRGPAWRYPVEGLAAKLALIEGRDRDSIWHLRRTVELLEQAQVEIALDLRSSYLSERGDSYRSLVTLLLADGECNEALEYAERSKARSLVEQLQLVLDPAVVPLHERDEQETRKINRWLEERAGIVYSIRRRVLQPEASPESESEGPDPEERLLELEEELQRSWRTLVVRDAAYGLQRRQWQTHYESAQAYLEPHDLLLEFFDDGVGLVGFQVKADEVSSFRVPMHETQLRQQLKRLRTAHAMAGTSTGDRQAARAWRQILRVCKELYDGILLPIQESLGHTKNLIIVPDGLLQFVPWSALFDGESHLIQQYTLSILPSSSILRYLTDRIDRRTELVSIGYDCDGRLPHAIDEARSVAEFWGGAAVLGRDATVAAASAALQGSKIVHFATHAIQHPSDPLFSGIELADGWLTCMDIHRLRGRAPLVVLSACHAGLNRAGQGEAMRGLTHALLCAGARSLVAPMHTVDDRMGKSLMRRFYQALSETESPALALRLATCDVLRTDRAELSALTCSADFQIVARI